MNSIKKIAHQITGRYYKLSITKKVQFGTMFTAITMLLSFLVIAVFYFYSVLLQQAINSAYNELSYTQKSIDSLLDKVETYSITLVSDETVQSVLSKPTTKNNRNLSADILKIQKTLNSLVGNDTTISAVLIYDLYGNIYDSGVTITHIDNSIYDYPVGTSSWVGTHKAPYRGIFDWTLDRQVISFIRSIGDYNTGKKIGYLQICVDERTISDLYLRDFENDQTVYMISPNGRIVSHPDKTMLYKKADLRKIPDGNARSFYKAGKEFVISWKYDRINWYILEIIPRKIILKPIFQMIAVVCLSGCALLIICIIISKLISRGITENITKLSVAMKEVEVNKGTLDVTVRIKSEDEIGALAVSFNNMLNEVRAATSRLMYEQNMKREYQLELLQQQINPHFLYNTLDNICALAELNNKEMLIGMVNDITRFYRGVLSKGSIIIPIRNEMLIATSYLNIMQVRYYQTFTYTVSIPENISNNVCLRLTLQPILENSISHGFKYHNPGGMIKIAARLFREYIVLAISDNGIGMTRETISKICRNEPQDFQKTSFGLVNAHERIRLHFGEHYGIKIFSRPGKGTRIMLKLPKANWRGDEHVEVINRR